MHIRYVSFCVKLHLKTKTDRNTYLLELFLLQPLPLQSILWLLFEWSRIGLTCNGVIVDWFLFGAKAVVFVGGRFVLLVGGRGRRRQLVLRICPINLILSEECWTWGRGDDNYFFHGVSSCFLFPNQLWSKCCIRKEDQVAQKELRDGFWEPALKLAKGCSGWATMPEFSYCANSLAIRCLLSTHSPVLGVVRLFNGHLRRWIWDLPMWRKFETPSLCTLIWHPSDPPFASDKSSAAPSRAPW